MTKRNLQHIHKGLRKLAVAVDELVPDPANARRHPSRNLDAIKGSLAKFGQRKPIVVQRDGMVVRAGNGTLEAARALGWEHIAALVVDEDDISATAFAIADNRTGELAEWDLPVLAGLVDAFPEDFDIGEIGFNADEIDQLLGDFALPDGPGDESSDGGEGGGSAPHDGAETIEPVEVDPVTQPGDVIDLGAHTLHCGDCVSVMKTLADNSIDAIVTDPPYGIGFMGKEWDCDVPGDAFAAEALRVLKPGGYMIAFAATRTVHRLACTLEDAGFEVRDQINWLQWQGFPKSLDLSKAIDKHHGAEREVVGHYTTDMGGLGGERLGSAGGAITVPATDDAKQWEGWGTALKPAAEPAVLVRKPLDGTHAANVLKWGVGGLNIDATRYAYGDVAWPGPGDRYDPASGKESPASLVGWGKNASMNGWVTDPHSSGRWPSNVYYCPKPSTSEREAGTDALPQERKAQLAGAAREGELDDVSARFLGEPRANIHPTVKPKKLMRWLLQLVSPPGATVLEPFTGSGSTLVAADGLDLHIVACELEPRYCDITRARMGDTRVVQQSAQEGQGQ